MIDSAIANQSKNLKELCRRYRVETLYLFGSAANGTTQSGRSDLDFLVTLELRPPGEYADNYLGLATSLEQLFARRVDLVSEPAIRNPYLRETILATRQLLYDCRHQEAIA